MKKEYDLKKLKKKGEGAVISKETKIQKTIRLDADVFSWLIKEANHRGTGYQPLINMLLKEKMNQSAAKTTWEEEEIRKIVKEEIEKVS